MEQKFAELDCLSLIRMKSFVALDITMFRETFGHRNFEMVSLS